METYSSITSSITSSGSRSNGSPTPPPPAEGRLKLSPSSTFKLEKNAPRNFSLSVPGLSQFPCGFDGSPPKIPQVTERERSQHTDITVSVTDRKSTRLNFSHVSNSYAVCCMKKKTIKSSTNP